MQSGVWLERYYFEKFLLEVSIATLERGGATSDPHTYQFLTPIDAWGLPRYPEKTLILTPEADLVAGLKQFLQTNGAYLRSPETWLGTWINPHTRCCHLDITEIYPSLEEARREALKRNERAGQSIIALYNFKRKQTIWLQEEVTLGA